MKFAYVLTALASFASAADSVEVVAQAAGLTSLLAAIKKVKLTSTVLALTNVTIFAPTNQAVDDLKVFALKNNIIITDKLLTKILQLHIVPSVVTSSVIVGLRAPIKAGTLAKLNLTVSASSGKVTISSPGNVTATVVTADVEISQGIVHVIDKVLLPDLSSNPTNGRKRKSATASNAMFQDAIDEFLLSNPTAGSKRKPATVSSAMFQGISLFLSSICLLVSL